MVDVTVSGNLQNRVSELYYEIERLQRRLDAVLALHNSEYCAVCETVFGCATRRAAKGEK